MTPAVDQALFLSVDRQQMKMVKQKVAATSKSQTRLAPADLSEESDPEMAPKVLNKSLKLNFLHVNEDNLSKVLT